MDSAITKHQKNVATVLHVAAFSKYFFPLGNFIVPIIFWSIYKKESEYINHHGKEVLNFQLSLLCYRIAGAMLLLPVSIIFGMHHFNTWDVFHFSNVTINLSDGFHWHHASFIGILAGIGHLLLFAVNIAYTIIAAMKANEGERYMYPFTFRFIK
ncbi:DUF4870 domain-containing protein [Kordia sp.]|uniref:DUF4870 domain-containing protein n=1 Tax=Kordia sp. TaxID=1965332 RepID=UPI003D28CB61